MIKPYKILSSNNEPIRVVDVDPRVTPIDGFRGQLLIVQDSENLNESFFQKQDFGKTTNWVLMSGGGSFSNETIYPSIGTNSLRKMEWNIPGLSDRARNIIVEGNIAYALLHRSPGYLITYDVSNILYPNCENLAKEIQLDYIAINSSPNTMDKLENYLYVGDNNGFFEIFDVSDPSNIIRVFRDKLFFSGTSQIFELKINKEKEIAAVAYASGASTTAFIDISDKENPQILTDFPGAAGGVSFDGEFAYSTQYSSGQVSIYDVSDKNNISLVNQFNVSLTNLNVAVNVENDILYVSDYINGDTEVYDVSDKLNPVLLSTITANSRNAFNNPVIIDCDGNFIYITTSEGIEMYNMTDPSNPVKVWEKTGILDIGSATQSSFLSQGRMWVARRNPDNFEVFILSKKLFNDLI